MEIAVNIEITREACGSDHRFQEIYECLSCPKQTKSLRTRHEGAEEKDRETSGLNDVETMEIQCYPAKKTRCGVV